MSSEHGPAVPLVPPPTGARAALCTALCDRVLSQGKQIVLYDGICLVCSWVVNFVTDHDPEQRTTFAPLQSELGAHIIHTKRIPTMDSMLLLDGGAPGATLESCAWHSRSTGVLRLVATLHPRILFFLAWLLLLVPAVLRDGGYKLFAACRYRIFGTVQPEGDADDSGANCRMVTKETRGRFLEYLLRDMQKAANAEAKKKQALTGSQTTGGDSAAKSASPAPDSAAVFAAAAMVASGAGAGAAIQKQTDAEMLAAHVHTHEGQDVAAAATEVDSAKPNGDQAHTQAETQEEAATAMNNEAGPKQRKGKQQATAATQ